ncbi:Beta-lactamase class C protein [Cystobacter fuscus DSM 2262]|uniref:Beta-lactamase class C protein n=1 Tax=Cystobacter fuscus (strain ATCC 25194 / DSM 2262 / NBRC 100088 / M29) TaxID=1242864 RepID=S9QGG3_CYSF2|nr:serine hydrolase domain-containing protein [Cystobacter fuscus]EPX60409.1 Beta-lactamase class C protein [Cystobacter fuscus DSM 2262]
MLTRMGSRFTAVMLGLVLGGAALAKEPAKQQVKESSSRSAIPTRLDAVIDGALADKRLVGTVVLVARDGQVIYHRAAGQADREAHVPMREDAVFRLASVSKPLVSAAAMALVDQGKLGLEDPVTKWLPTFRPKLEDGREPVITVRQLLTHTAGLDYGFFQPPAGPYARAGVSDGVDESGLSLEENLRRLASVPLGFEPGTRWHYSLSIDVLGAVVASAGGAPLPQVVERLITRPLGLRDTGFVAKVPKRLATPYADGKPEPVRMGAHHEMSVGGVSFRFVQGRALDSRAYPSGGAGMVGSAGELLKFLEAVRTGGAPLFQSSATAAAMLAPQTGTLELPNEPGWAFGFGGAVLVDATKAATPQSPGTWRWAGAYGHTWFVDPRRRLSVVALTNTAIEGMSGAFQRDLRDAVYAGLAAEASTPPAPAR